MKLKNRRVFCGVCGEPQFNTPSGLTCKNGHGGEESLDKRPEKPKRDMGWSHYLVKLFASHVRYWFHDYTNAICISCGNARHKMIRVGCLFFCIDCFTRDFDYKLKKRDEAGDVMYKKYLARYIEHKNEHGVWKHQEEDKNEES
jgi:hypothetical protein